LKWGSKRELLNQQLCSTVTDVYSQDCSDKYSFGIELTRKSDGKDLGRGFKAADLASPAGGGTLLEFSLELKKSTCARAVPD